MIAQKTKHHRVGILVAVSFFMGCSRHVEEPACDIKVRDPAAAAARAGDDETNDADDVALGQQDVRDARAISTLVLSRFDLILKQACSMHGARPKYRGEVTKSLPGQRIVNDFRDDLTWNVGRDDNDPFCYLTLSTRASSTPGESVTIDGKLYYVAVSPYSSEVVDVDCPQPDLGFYTIRDLLNDVKRLASDRFDE